MGANKLLAGDAKGRRGKLVALPASTVAVALCRP